MLVPTGGAERKTIMKTCNLCDNSGITTIANGTDDFDYAYCSCKEGKVAEAYSAMKVLKVDFIESEGQPDVFLIN